MLRPICVTAHFTKWATPSATSRTGQKLQQNLPFYEMGNEENLHYTNGAIDFLMHRDIPIFMLLEINHFQNVSNQYTSVQYAYIIKLDKNITFFSFI